MRGQNRVVALLALASCLALAQWAVLPIVGYQNQQILRNGALQLQVRKADRRIEQRAAQESRRQLLEQLLNEARIEAVQPNPESLLKTQQGLTQALEVTGVKMQGFEWTAEVKGRGVLTKKQAVMTVVGSPNEIAAGALALAQRQPLSHVVKFQLRNVGRGGLDRLSGTMTSEILIFPPLGAQP